MGKQKLKHHLNKFGQNGNCFRPESVLYVQYLVVGNGNLKKRYMGKHQQQIS